MYLSITIIYMLLFSLTLFMLVLDVDKCLEAPVPSSSHR